MSKDRAIPQGYMTVGELAKKMGTTVRTLQYYDRENILTPSAESEGGRRLYTDKDMVKLHQIMSLKYLGFSLDDIKKRLVSLDTPADVAGALAEQAAIIERQIENLSETLEAVNALKEEVLQMQVVDFKKYADIITNLKMKNENYWLIKYFDEKMLEHCENNFDHESALEISEAYKQLSRDAVRLQGEGIHPDSEESIIFAQKFWDMIMKFTGGDMSLLPKLMELGQLDNINKAGNQAKVNPNEFIGAALQSYFSKTGMNPFEGESQ